MILFLSSISANGQSDLWCATPENVPEDPTVNYSKSTDLATLQNGIPTVFNIFYWQINDENGNSTAPLTEQKNASEINNDQLINSLDPGLYKIEKDYSDGYKEEIIITKSDN